MPTTVFLDPYVKAARYALNDGPVIQIPMDDLRAALSHSPERDLGRKVGPYNIDPFAKRIEDTIVRMEFGPFLDLRREEIDDYHRPRFASNPRQPIPKQFYDMADIVLERVRGGSISFSTLAERIRDLNPTLNLHVSSDGSISRTEVAYALRVNYLRALESTVDELTR